MIPSALRDHAPLFSRPITLCASLDSAFAFTRDVLGTHRRRRDLEHALMTINAYNFPVWPRSLEVPEVEKHKDFLIQRTQAAHRTEPKLVARSLARGALFWQRWLVEKDPENNGEQRFVVSLELARDAGDWKEAELLLAHCESTRNGADPLMQQWRDTIRNRLPQQVENEQRLEIAFQRFRNAQTMNDDTARIELARELMARAKAIGEVGSPVAVNNLLARISASVGWNEEAETYYTALVVCRPLWIPYIVQLSEHQAKNDIKRAFQTLETAKALLGKDFWLVT
jgi:hypothetical protein